MTHEQKIGYMKIATGICHFGFKEKDLDMLVSIYDLVLEKEGSTDLQSIAKVKAGVEAREEARMLSDIIDNWG